jgi:aromatic-L-amino-acid/L-tryptophan decarboxylase
VFNSECAPSVTELKVVVLDWLAKAPSLPTCYLSSGDGGAAIQGITSESIAAVMVAAREWILNQKTANSRGEEKEEAIMQNRAKMIVLGSEVRHSCTAKAAKIVGLRYQAVLVSIEDDFSMRGYMLHHTLYTCCQAGLEPFSRLQRLEGPGLVQLTDSVSLQGL